MAASIPSALKAADIARFAHRAGQLEKARPAVAYWCNYWIVEQIISKGLHKPDEDSTSYTMGLVDRLEQTKVDFADNDAIVDDTAGHAYVEQFAQETFQRAENAMKANKVSRQTADTFQAAATFLELNQIWGPLDQDVASKIKFAKYHALRIAKAIKAGEDPNSSNPVLEGTPSNEEPPQKPSDFANEAVNGQSIRNQQPSAEEVSDDRPSPQETYSAPVENYYHQSNPPDVSPLAPSSPEVRDTSSTEYFPQMSGQTHNAVNADQPSPIAGPQFPASNPAHLPEPPSDDPSNAFTPGPRSMDLPSTLASPPALPQATPSSRYHQPSAEASRAGPSSAGIGKPSQSQLKDDDASVAAAQKHAKFAISALNFEDVPTAVKEFQGALRVLGAL